MKTIEGNFDNPEVNQLLKKHFIELRSVSPEGSTHVLDIEGLQDKSIKFWSIYENDELIGCGALKFLDPNHGELKSIRVADPFRNKGNGKKIIKVLLSTLSEIKPTGYWNKIPETYIAPTKIEISETENPFSLP